MQPDVRVLFYLHHLCNDYRTTDDNHISPFAWTRNDVSNPGLYSEQNAAEGSQKTVKQILEWRWNDAENFCSR